MHGSPVAGEVGTGVGVLVGIGVGVAVGVGVLVGVGTGVGVPGTGVAVGTAGNSSMFCLETLYASTPNITARIITIRMPQMVPIPGPRLLRLPLRPP